MIITKKEMYILKRKKKKIKLTEIANHIKCTPQLLSMYENEKCDISEEKLNMYKKYIDEKE
ncbi:hypothetical protein [Desulfotomaculum nigrificans]|uniref:hypothetical protein n=1 Tax=Desulfotomaculum nigrificans TaxID=1565 RepID=UPI0001FAECE3|nr:hypothetical protein [Desulfotomaculum nigrificans]